MIGPGGEGLPPPQQKQVVEKPKAVGKLATVKKILTAPKADVEAVQIGNFQDMLAAIAKHGSMEAAQKAEPKLFATGGVLSILAGHPGKAPK